MPAEFHEDRRCGVDGDAASQRQIALPRPQRSHRHMQRHQRRRTRRIHRHRRTLQPQHIGHPTRGDAGQLAGQPEAFYRLGGEHAVALRHYPGEYPGGAAAQSGRIDTGPLQRLPGQLQQHPMLWIHREGLARPHPEEGGVEVADPPPYATPPTTTNTPYPPTPPDPPTPAHRPPDPRRRWRSSRSAGSPRSPRPTFRSRRR
ncbi:Uncharacterised protein [Mycobacterium tuberculosis]|nr:Uncharacterised protein [Mycobacterium tuberculosis]